jgi:membrane carboxypeptidase/penicillin-binding protein PbpC
MIRTNYNHRFYGPLTLRFALANSLNMAAIKVLEQDGGPETLYSAHQTSGITTLGHPAAYLWAWADHGERRAAVA